MTDRDALDRLKAEYAEQDGARDCLLVAFWTAFAAGLLACVAMVVYFWPRSDPWRFW